jgi:4-alpha-glucanotransferase
LGNYFKSSKWQHWPERIRNRDPKALKSAFHQLSDSISRVRFVQYLFYRQWQVMKRRCNDKGIHIMGDMPIYVPHESADTWAHPQLFKLDRRMEPIAVSGVPPDYFSETGQLWGHPVFKWRVHLKSGFDWWMRRIDHNMALYDYLRIDHFRGLVAYWEIPANEKTAINGKWVKAPARAFFNTLFRRMPRLPIIAEDLGYITPDVREVIRDYDIPGMRVLVFGFSGPPAENPNAPHNIDSSCVVYTGTHDTNTARGWFAEEAEDQGREQVFQYFEKTMSSIDFARELVRTAQMSPAWLCILPMQDLLALGNDARINRPGTTSQNWRWQLAADQVNPALSERLWRASEKFGRI